MEQKSENKKEKDIVGTVIIALLLIATLLVLVNTVRLFGVTANAIAVGAGTEAGTGITGQSVKVLSSSEVLPQGVPSVYGEELGIKYDDVSPTNQQLADSTIRKLANYDTSITLTGSDLEKYKKIGVQISCEYCCGAESIIFNNGQAACGCAHSYAMRGLAKYLITEHPDMTDKQILEEMGKWKVLFFPEIHQQKAAVLKEKGIEMNYINLASNKYRGIEQGASGSMVGGC
ncbi:MAG: hypothetical protein AABX59_04100, partial [Nanoarchaeota archaeon]